MSGGKALLCWVILFFLSTCFIGVCGAVPIMVEKNLFSQERKPVSDEEPPPQVPGRRQSQVGLPPRSVQLDGVFIHDDTKKALLRVNRQLLGEPRGGARDQLPYMTVGEGESIGNYKVIKIDPRSISLEKDKEVYVINLFMDGKVVPPATPLPAAPISPPEESPAKPPAAAPAGQPQQAAQASQAAAPGQNQQPATPPGMPAAIHYPGVSPEGANQPPAAQNVQAPPPQPQAQ